MVSAAPDKIMVLSLVDKSGFGGVQTIAYTMIGHGLPGDVEMSFFFLRNINSRFKMADIIRPNVFYSRAVRRYSLLPFFEILQMVGRSKVDILHLNGNKSVILGVLLKMLFFPRLKLIAHEHGGVFDYTLWYPLFLKLAQRRINLFLTVSNYRKQFLVSRSDIDPDKVKVLNNFVDRARLCSDRVTAGSRDRSDGRFVVGYVGGLSRIKGCDVLIRAIALLKGKIQKLNVIVAGDGPARDELEKLAETLEVREMITFLGFVDKPGKVYADFDVMVIPSRSEEGPICLYEAWLMGLPVIASNARVLDERIRNGETGMFFESENHVDLADKILLIHANAEIRDRIRLGGSREVVHHSVEKYLESMEKIYKEL